MIIARDEVGLFCAVADADQTVKDISDVVLQSKGGSGIFKEILNDNMNEQISCWFNQSTS